MIAVADLNLELTQMLMPFISALILLVISLWFKDFAASLARGLSFRFNRQFNEGDLVILDGEPSIIIKIGISQTVFEVIDNKDVVKWRYVPNQRIAFVKLEKIIVSGKPAVKKEHDQ